MVIVNVIHKTALVVELVVEGLSGRCQQAPPSSQAMHQLSSQRR